MKKIGIAFTLCVILFSVNSLAQDAALPYLFKESVKKSSPQLKQSMAGSYPRHTEEFKWETNWVLFRTIETSYETFGAPKAIEATQDGNKTRELYAYDNQHRQTEVIDQELVDGVWVNVSRHSVSYTDRGFLGEFIGEKWNGSTWERTNGSQMIYEMDGDRLIVLTSKVWNGETSTWDNMMRETYSYSEPGLNYSSAIMEMWDVEWVLTMKYEYTWHDNEILESLSYSYENGEWSLTTKTVYDFQGDTKSVMTTYSYTGPDEWMPTSRMTTENDDHGNTILHTTEMYMDNWVVFVAMRFQLTYSGNNLTERITQTYSLFPPAVQGTTSGLFYKNVLKEVYSNFASMSSDIALLPDTEVSVFPNPAGKEAIVRLSLVKSGAVTLSVYSLTGQEIIKENLSVSGSSVNHQLNLNEVRPGSYVLIVRDNQGNEIGKTRLVRIRE